MKLGQICTEQSYVFMMKKKNQRKKVNEQQPNNF